MWIHWSHKKTINRHNTHSETTRVISEDSVEFDVYPCCCLVYTKYKLSPYTIKTMTTFCCPCGYISSDIHENGRTFRVRNTDENPEIQSMSNDQDFSRTRHHYASTRGDFIFTSNLRHTVWCLSN